MEKVLEVKELSKQYTKVLAAGHIGMGVELAELTERGISQAEAFWPCLPAQQQPRKILKVPIH